MRRASAGFAHAADAGIGNSLEQTYRRADEELYSVKRGRQAERGDSKGLGALITP